MNHFPSNRFPSPLPHYLHDALTSDSLHALSAPWMDTSTYAAAHEHLVMACHDVFIEYAGKLLLIERNNEPAKGLLWPLGGRLLRGMPAEASLRQCVEREATLILTELQFLGVARTYFATAPFSHEKGTDTLNLVYVAKGHGQLQLDDLHLRPTLVGQDDFTQAFQQALPDYVREFMAAAFAARQPGA